MSVCAPKQRGMCKTWCNAACEYNASGKPHPKCDVCGTEKTIHAGAKELGWTCHHCISCEDCGEPYDECFDRRWSYKVCAANSGPRL